MQKVIFRILMFWVVLLGCQKIKGQTVLFSQNFESTTWTIPSTLSPAWSNDGSADNQWQMNTNTNGWTFPNLGGYFPTGANGTNKSARFHSYGASSGSTGSLISPTINFPASNCQNKNLSFNIINTDGVDKVNVYISTDGGTNWGSTIGTFGNYSNWTLININIGTTTSNNVKVKFVATSDWGFSDIGIDEIVISSNTIPSPITISPPSATICSGSSKTLTASGGDITGVSILSENFNGAAIGWTNTNTSTGGTPNYASWTLMPNNYNYSPFIFNSNDNTQFYLSNSDAQGSNSITNTTLVSPSFSTLGFNTVSLNFFQNYYIYDGPEFANVEVSIDNLIWNTLTSYNSNQGSNNNFVSTSINLPLSYLNQPTVYIRFNYSAKWDFYWAIDNVTITGNKSANFTWSPNINLSTTIGATVTASPTTTQTYTATSTINGCSNSGNVTVTVNPINTIVLTSGTNSQTVCLNSAITNITYTTTGATGATVTGLPAGVTASWANNVVTISGPTTASGIFNYTITLTGGCGSITTTGTIIVNKTPNTPSSISGNSTPCSNTPSLIYSITAVTGATSYSWAVPTPTSWSITSGQGTTSITVMSGNTSQNGTITVSASNICGTSLPRQLTVTVSTNTVSAASSSPTLCVNSALTNITYTTTLATGISNSGVTGANGLPSGVSASWSSNTITISGTPTVSGTFNYSIPLTGGCGNVNATGTITITPSVSYGSVSSLTSNTNSHLVISQIYTAGGNSNATYITKYVELYNPTSSSISINGWALTYVSQAAGVITDIILGNAIIPSGSYYLIAGQTGTTGSVLPITADQTFSLLSPSQSDGSLVLHNSTTSLTGPSDTTIVDILGWGNITSGYKEGTTHTTGTNTNSLFRKNNGCTDTNDNNSDFISAIASPRNSSSPANICGGSTETICSGATPSAMSALGATGSTFTYQWYYQNGLVSAPTGTSTTNWISLGTTAGANTATYTPTTGITSNTTYAVLVTPANCGTATWASGNRQVTVQVTGGTIASNQTICSTKIPAAFTSITYATSSGGTAINYQWESSTDNFATPGVAIASANSVTYSPGSLTATTYYRRKATSIVNLVSCSAYSNILTITINPNPSTTLIYHQ